jgi:hypothetical protein
VQGPGYGWDSGRGGYGARGAGRGRRNWYYRTGLTGWQRAQVDLGPRYAQPAGSGSARTNDQQVADLKARTEYLESALSEVRRELDKFGATEER